MKTPSFETRQVVEQRPFKDPAVQSFFNTWCEINDSIMLHVVTREQWDTLGMQGILVKRPNEKQTLFIPDDLRLWEMIGVIEVIDRDTFVTNPERAPLAKEKMLALGRTFENAGVYIARRLEGIAAGREIAEALALEFYQYGQSLTQGKTQEISQIGGIASRELTPEETKTIDKFLAGDTLYESRRQRVEELTAKDQTEKDEFYERERQRSLAQFFRVAARAFALEIESADGTLKKSRITLKPWQRQDSFHSAFLRRIYRAMTKQIEAPRRELETAIFQRGLEKLIREMTELREERRLMEVLNISQLRTDLEAIRQNGDLASISSKEREIADIIQKTVSSFPFYSFANNPSEMVVNQYINCLGASLLGGALMKEAGLNYLVGSVPKHSILFLVTSDGQVEWRDMLNVSANQHLTNEMIKGQRRDGESLTVADIVAFSKKPSPEGLMFDIQDLMYRDKMHWIKENQRQYVTVYQPEYGQQISLLNNTGADFIDKGLHGEAVEALRHAIGLDLNDADAYLILGMSLLKLGRDADAVGAFQQAIDLDPNDANAYFNLGMSLLKLGRDADAVQAFQQAIEIDPKYTLAYYNLGISLLDLGRDADAVGAFQQAIDLDPNDADAYRNLGISLYNLGRDADAVGAFQQAIDLDPNDAYQYKDLGDALVDLGRDADAVGAFQQAIDLDPNDADAYRNLGISLYNLGRDEEAVGALRQAVGLDPNDAYQYKDLGDALANLGRHEEAVQEFQKFIDLADKVNDDFLIKQVEQIIAELKK